MPQPTVYPRDREGSYSYTYSDKWCRQNNGLGSLGFGRSGRGHTSHRMYFSGGAHIFVQLERKLGQSGFGAAFTTNTVTEGNELDVFLQIWRVIRLR